MPPKRKAAALAAENEAPPPRRLTRSTATTVTSVEAPTELPPPKRPRRAAKTDDGLATKPQPSKVLSAPSTTKASGRASRAATRTRKGDADAEDPPAPKPSVPKKRVGRGKKEEEEAEASHPEEPAAPPKPLSPARANAVKAVPKKRTRSTKTQEVAVSESEPQPDEAGSSRPKRTRRTKDSTATAVDLKPGIPSAHQEVAQPSQADVSPSTVKGHMKRKAAGPSAVPKVGPPKVSSPLKAKAPAPPAKVPENDGDESSDDELLLTSENRPATPTPIRTSGSRIGTPRMVLDSVGIRTPRHLLNSVKRSYGSPTPTGAPARAAPLGTLRLPSAASGSPVKRNVPLPPSSALRQRALRTPSPEPAPPPPVSPTRIARKAGAATPSKRQRNLASQRTDGLPRDLPEDLHPLLERQKRAILRSLQQPPEIDEIEVYGEDYPPTNTLAYEQLRDLLTGSVVRGEGNSCLLIGPSGSGKTQMVERAIAALPAKPIIVRLSGYAQHNDRLAIREIAWQLAQQTGTSFLPAESDEPDEEDVAGPPALVEQGPSTEVHDEEEGDDDENPFVDHARVAPSGTVEPVITLPPPSHLLALISMIPTLPRPTVIVLDGFDLFASHARQALLYCLLDTAQACRTGTGAGSGMAVVGVTARVDTINILEKRVKSRFSGRMIRTACPTLLDHWVALAKAIMGTPPVGDSADGQEGGEWAKIWGKAVKSFVEDEGVVEALRDVYALTRDFQIFRRIMTCLTLELTTASPYPTVKMLKNAISRQRCPARYPQLHTLPYPAICLLIAQVHAQTSGHDAFTFEMLHDAFKSQVRTSQAAPVQLQGGGVGMVRCSREVLFSAFERLVDLRIFLPTVSPAASIAKEFTLHRSAVDRAAVKKAVDQVGQMSLRKWFTKA